MLFQIRYSLHRFTNFVPLFKPRRIWLPNPGSESKTMDLSVSSFRIQKTSHLSTLPISSHPVKCFKLSWICPEVYRGVGEDLEVLEIDPHSSVTEPSARFLYCVNCPEYRWWLQVATWLSCLVAWPCLCGIHSLCKFFGSLIPQWNFQKCLYCTNRCCVWPKFCQQLMYCQNHKYNLNST